jgi:hypothetical protein
MRPTRAKLALAKWALMKRESKTAMVGKVHRDLASGQYGIACNGRDAGCQTEVARYFQIGKESRSFKTSLYSF